MGTNKASFDHGAALRVPSPDDARGWGALMAWLGQAGRRFGAACVHVSTGAGVAIAAPGDWIVLSVSGEYHVAFASGSVWNA